MLETIGGSENQAVHAWVESLARLCQPSAVHWCDGSDAENAALIKEMLAQGTLI